MKYILVILIFQLTIIIPHSAQPIAQLDQATLDLIDATVSGFQPQLTGYSVAIIYDGAIAYANAFGTKNANDDAFSITTKSLLASISKTITATIAMRLVQEGNLGLDDPVTDYIGDSKYNGMTIRHLLAHQTGIDHYNSCPDGYDGPWNIFSSINTVAGCNVCMLPPGSGSLYSTQGFVLLGAIIDIIADLEYNSSYEGLYESWIRKPGGLTTLEPVTGNQDLFLAQGYSESGSLIGGTFNDLGWRIPSGGFQSNILDLARYGVGILNNTFINQFNFITMTSGQPVSGDTPSFICSAPSGNVYGLGWRRNGSGSNYRIWHDGLNEHGYSSYLALYPNSNAGIVILANEESENNILRNMASLVEDLIICPTNRDFTQHIDWNQPNRYTASNEITLSNTINPSSFYFRFEAGKRVILQPGAHFKGHNRIILTTGGCE